MLPEVTAPQIDFSAMVVVGVMAGFGSNGCAGLSILRAVEETTRIRVEYVQSDGTVPPGTACSAELVQLVSFVKLPYSTKPVAFVRKDA